MLVLSGEAGIPGSLAIKLKGFFIFIKYFSQKRRIFEIYVVYIK